MDDNLYLHIPKEIEEKLITPEFRQMVDSQEGTTYVIDTLLDSYFDAPEYQSAAIICFPGKKIILADVSNDGEAFEDYVDDLREKLSFLYRSKDYNTVLGSIRKWWDELFVKQSIKNQQDMHEAFVNATIDDEDYETKKKAEMVVSLLIASYNDVSNVSLINPTDLLDAVKNKIMLFDTDQSKFLFSDDPNKKRIVIQGMAGTGKTELLLHKLKNAYVGDKESRICFTCFNKVLLSKLKQRIPAFFNVMRVSEQIAWDQRLFVMASWGSARDKFSGLYSYICDALEIPFRTYDEVRNKETIWEEARDAIQHLDKPLYLFDYLFVDEAQDFPDVFFEVCELITSRKVIVGLDIYQDIFIQRKNFGSFSPDVVLKRCYRTDPHTLMFAHALCLGSLDETPLSYLSDKELDYCGYQHAVIGNKLKLSRVPLRRFFESEKNNNPISMIPLSEGKDKVVSQILAIVDKLRGEFNKLRPADLCIVFLDQYKDVAGLMDRIGYEIENRYGWSTNAAVDTKVVNEGVFITNRNNVKGLEFPFVIVVITGAIGKVALAQRNAIYMALTRSFLRSYLLIDKEKNQIILQNYQPCIDQLNRDDFLLIPYQSPKKIETIRERLLNLQKGVQLATVVHNICEEEGLSSSECDDVMAFAKSHIDPSEEEEAVVQKIRNYISLIKE